METSTMTMQETIEALYDAFTRGDVPFILDHVSDHFTWEDPCDPSIVPYAGTHKNKDGFLNFFQQLGAATETTHWEVYEYISQNNSLAATGRHGFHCKKTGKDAITDWVMVWHFEDGEPINGKAFYNTAVVEDAFR